MEARANNPTKIWRPFPELRNAEIVQILDELRIPITEADILKPNPATIQRVYELFLELFMGIPPSAATSQPTFEVLELLEHPDLHLDAISLMTFHKNISKLMESVGIEDFTLKDVLKPEPARLKVIFSGIINFAKFREEQLVFFEQHSSKAEEIQASKVKSQARLAEQHKRLQYILKKQTEEQPAVEALQEKVNCLSAELKELKREQAGISHTVESLKAKKDEYNDLLSSEQYTVVSIKQDIAKLQSRIVSNPEELIQSLKNMSMELAHEKENIQQQETTAKLLAHRNNVLHSGMSELAKTLQKMKECEEMQEKKLSLESKLAFEKENIQKKEQYTAEIHQKELLMRRQLSSQQEKLDKMNVQQSQKRAVIEESLKSLRDEYESVSKERNAVQEKINQNEKIIKETENQIYELKRQHDADVNALQDAVGMLKSQIQSYHADLRKHLVL